MKLGSFFALLAVALCGAFTHAQEMEQKAEQCDGTCPLTAATKAEECDGTCPIAAAMNELPKMTYQVGTEATCCSKSAAELAKKHSQPIQFVVGKNTYKEKSAAMASLVTTTESYVNEFLTPCKCEVSGTTKIAGKTCNCPIDAGKKTELATAAAAKVSMSFAVGEKNCNCPMEAAKLATASGAEKVYVVGEEKTCCEMTARLNLARAKYKAAVAALSAAEKSGT
jgi:hypothetical protein